MNEYKYEDLRKDDKKEIDVIQEISDEVLNNESIEDFIDSKNVFGETTKEMLKELLMDYTAFLKEQVEYCKVDRIISMIDGYDEN